MPFYSRQAPRAYSDNSGSQVAQMFGSAASTVAHGVEDYVSGEEKAKAIAEHNRQLEKARRLEAALKQRNFEEEMRLKREGLYSENEREADLADKEDQESRKGRLALQMFANPEDYYGKGEDQYSGADYMFSGLNPSLGQATGATMPSPEIQVTQGQGKALPEDPLSRKLMIASDAELGLDQTKQFLSATQEPRDFAGELDSRLANAVRIAEIRADAYRYGVDNKKFNPNSGARGSRGADDADTPETLEDAATLLYKYKLNKAIEQKSQGVSGISPLPGGNKAGAAATEQMNAFHEWAVKHPQEANALIKKVGIAPLMTY